MKRFTIDTFPDLLSRSLTIILHLPCINLLFVALNFPYTNLVTLRIYIHIDSLFGATPFYIPHQHIALCNPLLYSALTHCSMQLFLYSVSTYYLVQLSQIPHQLIAWCNPPHIIDLLFCAILSTFRID